MASTVEVDPAQLDRAATAMGKVRDDVRGILDTLRTSLAARGAAWGEDSYGSSFYSGAGGYHACGESTLAGVDAIATVLGEFGTVLRRAADLVEHNEAGAAALFR